MPFRGKWPRGSARGGNRQRNLNNFVRGHDGGLRRHSGRGRVQHGEHDGHGGHNGGYSGRGGRSGRGGHVELTATPSTNIYSNALDALGQSITSIVSVG